MTGAPPMMPDYKLDVTGAPVIASSAVLDSRFATHEKKFRKDVDCIAASMV